MKFLNEIDLLQFFSNEYIKPKSKILVLGCKSIFKEIQLMIEFIDSEIFFVNQTFHEEAHFTANYNNLPFEENSFDTIINFTDELNYPQAKLVSYLFQFLKENGTFLTKDEILNGIDYYSLNSEIFTILKN